MIILRYHAFNSCSFTTLKRLFFVVACTQAIIIYKLALSHESPFCTSFSFSANMWVGDVILRNIVLTDVSEIATSLMRIMRS